VALSGDQEVVETFDHRAGQGGIEGGGELAGAVADEEPEGGDTVVEVHQQVAGQPLDQRDDRWSNRC
jgi:hypothetical protein